MAGSDSELESENNWKKMRSDHIKANLIVYSSY